MSGGSFERQREPNQLVAPIIAVNGCDLAMKAGRGTPMDRDSNQALAPRNDQSSVTREFVG
jgi:hypothetical protein